MASYMRVDARPVSHEWVEQGGVMTGVMTRTRRGRWDECRVDPGVSAHSAVA
jgi:hypothetical protein